MSFTTEQSGQSKTVIATLPVTDLVIYTAPSKTKCALKSISFCNRTATATTFDLLVTSPLTSDFIYSQRPLAARETFILDGHNVMLSAGWSISAKAGLASTVDCVAVFAEANSV